MVISSPTQNHNMEIRSFVVLTPEYPEDNKQHSFAYSIPPNHNFFAGHVYREASGLWL